MSQKASSGDISGTKCSIIDLLVPKRLGNNSEEKKFDKKNPGKKSPKGAKDEVKRPERPPALNF